MAIDWNKHYDRVYDKIGVGATLTVGVTSYTVTVVDKTAGVLVGSDENAFAAGAQGVGIYSLLPACDIRNSELLAKSLTRAQLRGATLVLDGSTWTVRNTGLRFKEIRMYLKE